MKYYGDATIHNVKKIEVKTNEHDNFICIKLIVYNDQDMYTDINLFISEKNYSDFEFDISGIKFNENQIQSKIKKLFGIN